MEIIFFNVHLATFFLQRDSKLRLMKDWADTHI